MFLTKAIVMFGFLLLLLVGILGLSSDRQAWIQWKMRHGKTYTSLQEERDHMAVWLENNMFVAEHNSRRDVSFKVALNALADKVITHPNLVNALRESENQELVSSHMIFAPASWDWREKGAVSPVQNQGLYADAQAVVATECVDSFQFIQTGKLESGSSVEVHDCCTKTPVATANVFQCVHNIGGLCSEESYPKSVGSCRNNTCSPVASVNTGMRVAQGDENAMMEAVYKTPVMALLDASNISFQLYQGGIYNEPNCSSTKLDHALQVVGYGAENGQDFWICKNSWGTGWGENGYMRIARNKGNMCGIASMTTYPV